MIGVAASERDLAIAEELFQLFKTPWMRAAPNRRYRVAVITDGSEDHVDADVLLVYGSEERECDRRRAIAVNQISGPVDVQGPEGRFPIYRRLARFEAGPLAGELQCYGGPVEYQYSSSGGVVRRIGYDIFEEIRFLLSVGQPPQHALTPTLELHVEMLRRMLRECRVPFVEVLPRPNAHDFIACLTHDIDFYGIRRHRFDRTLAGFVARASVGSLIDFVRRRRPLHDVARNWMTLLRLPLIFLGLAPDVWRPFRDYATADGDRRSTFFLVPFSNRPGIAPDGSIDARRSVAYQMTDIGKEAIEAAARGAELAVHGIDAWRDSAAGRLEMTQLACYDSAGSMGVRMHWLYFDRESPTHIAAAGFTFDSTWGYNEAVGYRAGTSQVFQLNGTSLLELPMSIMDSALFYPSRMNLRQHDAAAVCLEVVTNAKRFGGTIVINWHDRSLAPERLWDNFYRRLLDDVECGNRVWFATAGEAVDWFRWRRCLRFTTAETCDCVVVEADGAAPAGMAGVIRVSRPGSVGYQTEDIPFNGAAPIRVSL